MGESMFESLSKTFSGTTVPGSQPFFSPVIQREENKKEDNCELYSDMKDLTWAAAKYFLETELNMLLGVVPVKFDCFDNANGRGCRITLKNGYNMLVIIWTGKPDEIHVQRPMSEKDPQSGFCQYKFSCAGGEISFRKTKCVQTW